MVLDFDPEITALASQPFWLHWPSSAGLGSHVPDFFARTCGGEGLVVDVRPQHRISEDDRRVFDATAALCADIGWQYRLVGDQELDRVSIANVRWLAGYRQPRCSPAPSVRSGLLSAFAESQELGCALRTFSNPLSTLPAIYHLLWRRELHVDLSVRLSMSSTIRVPASELPG
jgi:hypothetical protein